MRIHIYKKEPVKDIENTRIYIEHIKYSKISEMKEKCKLISYVNNYTCDGDDGSPCLKNNKCWDKEKLCEKGEHNG